MVSSITNCYTPNAIRRKLEVERAYLYLPQHEWSYSHHASITRFGGRYCAIWSNGRIDEDAPGQRVLLSTSEDFQHWAPPRPLVDTLQGKHSELVLTAAGFHQHEGTLAAYFGQYEYTPDCFEDGQLVARRDHMDTCLRAVTTVDGHHWSAPLDMGIPIVPNHGPQATRSGRLIISGNISFPYTDEPRGLSGWTMSGIYPVDMADQVYDDSRGFWRVRQRMGWPAGLCEGACHQTDDGLLHMLLRATGAGHAGQLWLTESMDDGESWSPPQPVAFSDNDTKFHLGRWPDGRFFYVGCPDPEPRGARCPLVLSLSGDGLRFDQHFILADEEYQQKHPGLHKGGLYGYPHSMIYQHHLHVIVSLRKEAVMALRLRCDQACALHTLGERDESVSG